MKNINKTISVFLATFSFLFSFLFASCDNPLFIKATGLYEVTFSTNGGTSVASLRTDKIKEEPFTSRSEYTFSGWHKTSDFSDENVKFPLEITEDTTLYAKWLQEFSVSFETNGGDKIDSYKTGIIPESPNTSRTNYIFAGWFLNSEFSGNQINFPYNVTKPVTLYAKWIPTYLATFECGEGSEISSYRTATISSLPETTRDGFTFAGWYLDQGFTRKADFPFTLEADTTFYAKWTAIQCTITYYANGATSGTVPESTTVDKGSSYTVLGNTGNLEKTGFAFTKWNARTDGIGSSYSAGSTITVTSDVSLYAQWGKDYAAMITVPAGSYYFGDPNSSSARPKITLSSFQIAQYELTYELWLEVYSWGKNNNYAMEIAGKGYATNDQYKSFVPATNLSWNAACVWLNAYSEYKNLEPVYYRGNAVWRDDSSTNGTFKWDETKNGYRLPTECEWEFAAGGGDAKTHDTCTYSGSNTIGEVAWYYKNSGEESHTVGTKKANKLGIYDMSGNVSEWVYDSYASFGTGELTNPVHESGSDKIYRGGNLQSSSEYPYWCKIFIRVYHSGSQFDRDGRRGFRVARNAE